MFFFLVKMCVQRGDHTAGCSQASSSILTGPRSRKTLRVFAHNTNQAGPRSHMANNHQRIITTPPRILGGKLQFSPNKRAGRPLDNPPVHIVPLLTLTVLPPSQTTNINMGAKAECLSLLLPLQPRLELQEEDELVKGFPKWGPGTSRRPFGGGESQKAGAQPGRARDGHLLCVI